MSCQEEPLEVAGETSVRPTCSIEASTNWLTVSYFASYHRYAFFFFLQIVLIGSLYLKSVRALGYGHWTLFFTMSERTIIVVSLACCKHEFLHIQRKTVSNWKPGSDCTLYMLLDTACYFIMCTFAILWGSECYIFNIAHTLPSFQPVLVLYMYPSALSSNAPAAAQPTKDLQSGHEFCSITLAYHPRPSICHLFSVFFLWLLLTCIGLHLVLSIVFITAY